MKLNTKTSWLILMAHSVLLYCCVRNISHGMGHIISSYMSVFVHTMSQTNDTDVGCYSLDTVSGVYVNADAFAR